jgi:hypothetical protein
MILNSNPKIYPFSQYVLRTPALPLSLYLNLLENYSSDKLLLLLENPFIEESIRLASPELLLALHKWKETPIELSNEKKEALEITLLKYIARITARCTPFGLFAGCTVGNITHKTNIKLESPQKFTRHTQFDMHFWVAMLQEFATRIEVMHEVIYYPNNSIYSIGDFYRYVEYKYVKTKREHSISAIRKSETLDNLLLEAREGITVNKIVLLLTDDDSEKEEALSFIYELINFQFLVSELDATITGNDEWNRVFNIIKNIPSLQDDFNLLQDIKKEFLNLDKNVVPEQEIYQNLKLLIEKTDIPFEEKFLFQTDLNITTSENTLNKNVPKKVQQALCFLNGLQKKNEFSNLKNFIKNFSQRYETREMPLVTVLDTEIGIGYIQDSGMNDSHNILDLFSFNVKSKNDTQEFWNSKDFILERKIKDCILKNEFSISISEKDFPDFDSNWIESPTTFSVMIEVFKNNENEIIVIESSGNVSASKLLGRFCNGNQEIHDLTKEIIEKEKQYHHDKILAEVVHIPESRTGNILRRPILRDYEIGFLSNSGVSHDFKIDLADLMVSINNNEVILRSKKTNKEIIPCLSNAHNFSTNSLPIYHFLCDLQSQKTKPVYNFSWGALESHYSFFPRVIYKDVILCKAKWVINKNEMEQFHKMESELFQRFSNWRNELNIPQYVNWVNFDNTLLLDFDKEICIKMFLKSVKNFKKITLEEFLFTAESIVKDINGENIVNQFILSFYKENN